MKLLLGVNLDHVATLRQARYAEDLGSGKAEPDLLAAAEAAKAGGADSFTLHVREDRRHVQSEDAFDFKEEAGLPLNLEMGATPEMVELALTLGPDFVCLVPENRLELTTEGGLDVAHHLAELRPAIDLMRAEGIKVSLFIDPEPGQVEAALATGAEMVELHTGAYANAVGKKARAAEVRRLAEAARLAAGGGLQVNAGHGIDMGNLAGLFEVPHLVELNIGHHLVSRAVFIGLEAAVREMKEAMAFYPEMK